MAIDAGDTKYRYGQTVTFDAGSNSVSSGDCVKFDGSGNITPTTANADDYVGVVQPHSGGADDDSKYAVQIAGLVVAVNIDGSVSAGDTLVPSATTNGYFENVTDSAMTANTGDADTDLYMNHPFALESGSDGETILASFR